MSDAKRAIDVEGAAAPPRRNGELVFREPWEGRAFGLAMALQEDGVFAWEAFRQQLIAAIGEADRLSTEERPHYYESWLAALEQVLVDRNILTPHEIENRIRRFATGELDIVNPGAE